MIVRVPGDKSISQRALLLAGLADGESRLRGVLPSADPRSTSGSTFPIFPTTGVKSGFGEGD